MAERIGFTRSISEEYLNAVANCKIAAKPLLEARDILNELIGSYITDPTNIKNTRVILLNTWYRNDPWLQEQCVAIAPTVTTDERLPLHWALLLNAYPVFFDLCSVIGSMLEYREVITSTQIKERLYDMWGARSTLQHSLTKNLKTMKDMRILEPLSRNGTYKCCSHTVDDVRIAIVLVVAILRCSGMEYMTWEEIIHHPSMFAFNIEHVTQADIAACNMLTLERMGDNVVIRIK